MVGCLQARTAQVLRMQLKVLRMMVSMNFGRCSPAGRPWLTLAVVLLPLLTLVFAGLSVTPASAQTCTSDTQCRDYGQTRGYCSGNTLVIRRSQCIGSCREVEVSRQVCPGPCVGDRCVGGPLVREPGSVPYGGGLVGPVCAQICTCKGKKLTYGVGHAKTTEQCSRRNVDCVYGCTCDPEPRCLKKGEV